jgi:hypothetical protein
VALFANVLVEIANRFLPKFTGHCNCGRLNLKSKHISNLSQKLKIDERYENCFASCYIPCIYHGSLEDEMNYLYCQIGVDGLFTEDVARTARFLAKGCSNTLTPLLPPSPSPSTIQGICDSQEKGRSQYLSTATGIMGFLLGILSTMFLMNSRHCKSQRHTRRQLRIPTHDDVEMI